MSESRTYERACKNPFRYYCFLTDYNCSICLYNPKRASKRSKSEKAPVGFDEEKHEKEVQKAFEEWLEKRRPKNRPSSEER